MPALPVPEPPNVRPERKVYENVISFGFPFVPKLMVIDGVEPVSLVCADVESTPADSEPPWYASPFVFLYEVALASVHELIDIFGPNHSMNWFDEPKPTPVTSITEPLS